MSPLPAQDVHVKTYGILPGKTFNGLQNGHCQAAESEGEEEGGGDIKSCLTFIRRARFQLGAAK